MRQRLGQHFLRDPRVIQTILSAAELKSAEAALEIGPGKGVLTEALARRARRLVAVELDRPLAAQLAERFRGLSHVSVVQADFLRWDFSGLANQDLPCKVFGNLPYSVASLIIEKLLRWPGWDTGIFLVQKEVAERMRSRPGAKSYGLLTLAVQLFAEVEVLAAVKPGAFAPPPEVQSAVIRLTRKTQRLLPASETPAFFDLAHGAFAHRRKTLANSLALHAQIAKDAVEAWLARQGLETRRRAETVSVEEFARLANEWAIFRRENGFDIAQHNVYNTRRFSD
jgi:16S rRNA (adenine1518-N6/adenine1519-N6)-dimethyltransferase